MKEILRDKRYWEEKRKRIHENEKRLEEVLERYKKELDDASKLRKTIIQEAQEKAKELISGANKTIENTIRQIKESQAEKEQTRLVRQTFEEEKRRLLFSEEEEEERLKRKIEKLKNREKKQKEKGKRTQTSTSEETDQQQQAPTFSKGDLVQLDNKAVGEIIEINEKNAVIAHDYRESGTPLENIEQCCQENHAKQDATPLFQLSGKHQPETHGFQTGDRRTRTTGRRGAHESIGIH